MLYRFKVTIARFYFRYAIKQATIDYSHIVALNQAITIEIKKGLKYFFNFLLVERIRGLGFRERLGMFNV